MVEPVVDISNPTAGEPVEMLLNMGPQHPSTHGVFRMVLWVDGEKIVRVEPHIGYLHRGSEKLCEGEQYHQVITLFDRLDYIGNFNNELAYCRAVEQLMGLVVPERAEYARVILCELNRIASHLLYIATIGLDAGAMTPSMFAFRGRERIQSLFEAVSGARMMHNYFRIGGIKEELPDNFRQLIGELLPQLRVDVEQSDNLLTFNEIFSLPTQGCGGHQRGGGYRLWFDRALPARLWCGVRRPQSPALLGLRPVRF